MLLGEWHFYGRSSVAYDMHNRTAISANYHGVRADASKVADTNRQTRAK